MSIQTTMCINSLDEQDAFPVYYFPHKKIIMEFVLSQTDMFKVAQTDWQKHTFLKTIMRLFDQKRGSEIYDFSSLLVHLGVDLNKLMKEGWITLRLYKHDEIVQIAQDRMMQYRLNSKLI